MKASLPRLIAVVLATVCLCAPLAGAADTDEERHHVTFTGEMGSNAFSYGIGYHYMVLPSLGLGGSIGIWGDPDDVSAAVRNTWSSSWDDYYGYYYDNYYDADWSNIAVYFEPSVLIRTPYLRLGGACAVGLSVNPWFRVSTNHYSSSWGPVGGDYTEIPYRSRVWAVGARIGPTFRFSMIAVTLGYGISNLDVDREYRTERVYRGKVQHTFSFGLAVYF